VSAAPKGGSRWLDSLARWAAGGHRDSPRAAAGSEATGGITRRTALRTAAGAGALAVLAPTRLMQPTTAGAVTTTLGDCTAANYGQAFKDFKSCTEEPFSEFRDSGAFIADYQKSLRTEKRPAARRLLMRRIKEYTKRRKQAQKDLEFCSAAFAQDRAEGESKCQAESPPEGNPPHGPGCESGYLLCGDYCCDTNYAFCQGCSAGPTCCRNGGNCCPSG
jgi:hypothetical protein